MSNWYEHIPYGPLTERDFIKLGSILQLSDPSDTAAGRAREVATQRLSLPEGSLRTSIEKLMAEFNPDSEKPVGEENV